MGWLDGQTALVTGAGSGIGRAVTERFVEEGASVGALELSGERVEALETELGSAVHAVQGDVTSYEDNETAVKETVDRFGSLDVFVGNAGVFDNMERLVDVEQDRLGQAFRELFEVNVLGYLYGARAVLPELLESEGNIVFTASHASLYPARGGILYTASKHAVAGIVRQLAYELAPKIRVNGVAPGFAATNLEGVESLDHGPYAYDTDDVAEGTPLQIAPEPEDYAGQYVFLASDADAGTATGTILKADAGVSVRGLYDVAGGLDL